MFRIHETGLDWFKKSDVNLIWILKLININFLDFRNVIKHFFYFTKEVCFITENNECIEVFCSSILVKIPTLSSASNHICLKKIIYNTC